MKSVYKQYKPFFQFLLKFLLFYIVFTFTYNWYLSRFNSADFEVDGITEFVAENVAYSLTTFGNTVELLPSTYDASVLINFNNDKTVCRIIEGCNAISIMILFAAFVFSFSKSVKRSLIFIGLGIIIIYVLNIVRIALLAYALYYFPVYKKALHDVVFPLFIYGVVFILWILWIAKFSGYERKMETKKN